MTSYAELDMQQNQCWSRYVCFIMTCNATKQGINMNTRLVNNQATWYSTILVDPELKSNETFELLTCTTLYQAQNWSSLKTLKLLPLKLNFVTCASVEVLRSPVFVFMTQQHYVKVRLV